jgi:hypothetical protein
MTDQDNLAERPTEPTVTEENDADKDEEARSSTRNTVQDGHDPANDQQQQTTPRSFAPDQELATARKRIGRELSQDTFSFLLVTDYSENKLIFLAAVGIWVFQVSIYLLVFFNSFDIKGDSSNTFSFPLDVDVATRIAEVRLPAERVFFDSNYLSFLTVMISTREGFCYCHYNTYSTRLQDCNFALE